MLLLRNHEIRGLMSLPEYIDAVEQGYREVGMGRGANFPRHTLWIAGDSSQARTNEHLKASAKAAFQFKGGLLPDLGGAGIQPYTRGLSGGLQTFMVLFDARTGDLAALMEVLYYDWLKTAAVSALATRYMAPAESSVVGLFGTGRHARAQLHGLREVRRLRRVQAYSRDAERRDAFSRKMSGELGIEVVSCSTPTEAIRDADIITTMTTSPTPVFDGHLLTDRPVHINAMGAHYPWVREIDEHVVLRSYIVVDELEQGFLEQGEILMPIEQGLLQRSAVRGDLGQVVAGKVAARDPAIPWTLFLSGGTGIEDVAVATKVYEAALEKGVGTHFEFGRPYEFEF